ncbi:MAG: hypothetical protein ACIALR_13085 [Blastopirellula sp. JB062]
MNPSDVAKPPPIGGDRAPRRAIAFVVGYSIVLLGLIVFMLLSAPSLYSLQLVLGLCLVSFYGTLTLVPALLVLAPWRCGAAGLLLFAAHGIIAAVIFGLNYLLHLVPRQNLYEIGLAYFALTIAVLSTLLAYWFYRRHWRIERISLAAAEETDLGPNGRNAPMSTIDYAYLVACVPAIWLLQQGAVYFPLSLPFGILAIAMMQPIAMVALRETRRGVMPGMLLAAGLAFCYAVSMAVWLFHVPIGRLLLVVTFSLFTLWTGLLLSLRGDGYRWRRDLSAVVQPDPIAEPDPLA